MWINQTGVYLARIKILIMILSMYLDTIQIYGIKVNPIDKMILGGNNGR